ncbi:hypothetical protein PG997_011429 [Apiospora hydei]|uniref:Uncharacterized protein n=1 Tax=Apiospora hydei TaxID=1337664 RepID=A0ABR1VLQ4_9PEZI
MFTTHSPICRRRRVFCLGAQVEVIVLFNSTSSLDPNAFLTRPEVERKLVVSIPAGLVRAFFLGGPESSSRRFSSFFTAGSGDEATTISASVAAAEFESGCAGFGLPAVFLAANLASSNFFELSSLCDWGDAPDASDGRSLWGANVS